MALISKKQINEAFWILRYTIGFMFVINGLQGLLAWHSLSNAGIAAPLPYFYNLGISGPYAIIISAIQLIIGVLFFTPFLHVAGIAAIAWILIMNSQNAYIVLAAVLAFSWISQAREQLKD